MNFWDWSDAWLGRHPLFMHGIPVLVFFLAFWLLLKLRSTPRRGSPKGPQ